MKTYNDKAMADTLADAINKSGKKTVSVVEIRPGVWSLSVVGVTQVIDQTAKTLVVSKTKVTKTAPPVADPLFTTVKTNLTEILNTGPLGLHYLGDELVKFCALLVKTTPEYFVIDCPLTTLKTYMGKTVFVPNTKKKYFSKKSVVAYKLSKIMMCNLPPLPAVKPDDEICAIKNYTINSADCITALVPLHKLTANSKWMGLVPGNKKAVEAIAGHTFFVDDMSMYHPGLFPYDMNITKHSKQWV